MLWVPARARPVQPVRPGIGSAVGLEEATLIVVDHAYRDFVADKPEIFPKVGGQLGGGQIRVSTQRLER
jgi:hypothetical protein